MKVYAVADLHGMLPKHVPECDILLIGGDIVPLTCHKPEDSAWWLDEIFRPWLERIPAKHVVACWGNHDFIGERHPELVPGGLRWTLLQDNETTVEGLRIWGTPWQPPFFDWAFNLPEEELDQKFALIPAGVDIILAHGPPYKILDRCRDGYRAGSKALLQHADRVRPKVVLFGHIHEAHGHEEHDGVHYFNVSLVNSRYQPVHELTEITHALENAQRNCEHEQAGAMPILPTRPDHADAGSE